MQTRVLIWFTIFSLWTVVSIALIVIGGFNVMPALVVITFIIYAVLKISEKL